ncbi:MAG TPA: hypothetical protein VLH80_07250 [Nitrospiraceae bacterium]|nr:hypothetical protein [Nitrospiraceae bacterium]
MIKELRIGPYVFESDNDGHFYVIPKARMADWSQWLESDDAQNGIPPDWADVVGGNPSLISFPEYSRD